MRKEKCTEEIKLHLGEKLKADLKEMAAMEGHDSLDCRRCRDERSRIDRQRDS